jgi:hypothetical protein
MSVLKSRTENSDLSRLEELFGLTHTDMQDVIMQGLLTRASATEHHAKTYAGTVQWHETVRAMRDKAVPRGWLVEDKKNCPLVVHPDGKLMIAVQTGDQETGTDGTPSNRAPKGAVTEHAVVSNYRQLCLFDMAELPGVDGLEERVLWVLLYHLAPNEIRYELSLPKEMVGGKIKSWQERIVFPSVRLDGIDIEEVDGNDSEDIDVPVERRPKQ